MKKVFITIIAMLLPMLAIGQNQTAGLIAEKDWTGGFAGDYPMWAQFADGQEGNIASDPDGVAITVGSQTGEFWQPQVIVMEDLTLEEGHSYVVKVTAKFPSNGTLQINMGNWGGNDQYTVDVEATGDFQEVEIEFPNYAFFIEGDGFIRFQCGDFKGTAIVKKIQVFDMGNVVFPASDICYNYIAKGKIAEVIPKTNGKYYGLVEIPSKVIHEGVEYTVKKINDSAFYGCSALKSVTIPNSITSIGKGAFSYCNNLSSITIPNSVTSIGDYVFENCIGLTSITIPSSVSSIVNGAFCGCTSLSSITIPNSVSTIGYDAFYGCTGLTSITIPNNVISIGSSAFGHCTSLSSITIPNNVTSIGSNTFYGCSSLSSIMIPNSVSSIGNGAFSVCTGLTSITIPNSVNSIGQSAFRDCSGLTSITIPNSVTYVDSYAFSGCNGLTSITIGTGVRRIYSNVFSNCEQLTDIYCMVDGITSVDPDKDYTYLYTCSDAFEGSYIEYATLHVPASALNAYKTTAPWNGFGSFETLSGEAPLIPKCATPTISFENGKIKFSCETEGAEFVSNISTTDTKDYYDAELTPSFKYKVTVYATKSGYDKSDTAIAEIEVPGELKGDLNKDGTVNVADHVELTKIIMNEE